jgi:hypothetical protein
MANPTTNYGFVLPTSTDLVTDLPADFDVALQGVDTRLKALNPSTTLGDTNYASATANTNTRLAIGSTGQVLTVAGGVPTWATPAASGSMTLINSGGTALSGATTTVGSIPGTYKELKIYVTDFYASGVNTCFFYLNTDSTASNYAYSGTRLFGSNLTGVIGENNSSAISYIGAPASDQNNNLVISIPNYADTTANKIYTAHSGVKDGSNPAVTITAHRWNNTAAITAINVQCQSPNTWSGGTVYVYGVN